ncbi:MAG: CoA transferase [Dehalococcoidia bacterium]|nr:CoA transferase [Dehalococcoidia bacterium]|tara:strand:- start:186 stop:1448 length:1263 start_codon:yes stop_codon:yes gene_type:complete
MTSGNKLAGPLTGLRVLELTSEHAQFCGKLMADLGADVIKVEPPGGQETRNVGPFLEDEAHPERSLYFWHYNTSKRGVTLDLNSPNGQDIFRKLSATAGLVLESFPAGYLSDLGLGYETLAKDNPGLIMCSVTPFGQDGPWRDYQTSDLLHLAAGGQMASSGYDVEDIPDAPPIAPGGGNAWHIVSHYSYIAIMGALYHRDFTGEGQYIDVSVHEACSLTTEGAIAIYLSTGEVVRRHTGRHASADMSPGIQHATNDGGYINTTRSGSNLTPARIKVLGEWMDGYGLAQDLLDDKYQDPAVVEVSGQHFADVLKNFFANMPLVEAYEGGQELNFPWGAIRTMEEIMGDPHLQDRDFFVPVEHPELGREFIYPGPAAIYNASPWSISRRAPLIGEHNQEIFGGELGLPQADLEELKSSGVI